MQPVLCQSKQRWSQWSRSAGVNKAGRTAETEYIIEDKEWKKTPVKSKKCVDDSINNKIMCFQLNVYFFMRVQLRSSEWLKKSIHIKQKIVPPFTKLDVSH